jgi:hypothetical protein
MSEYQFVHFLAIDRPLDDKQLKFMEQQSTRAEITRREFTNEYHFGDFHGDAAEMLRRGYDVHLHFANFGVRRLMFRLPGGLPCDRKTFQALCPEYGVEWIADKKGSGGILEICPDADAGSYEDNYFDVGSLLHEVAPIRAELIGGDVRALYLAWLACPCDDESSEPPVPAGLGKLTRAQSAMAGFYEVSDDLLAAAAERSPPLAKSTDAGRSLKAWIDKQSKDELRSLVRQLLASEAEATRAETLSRIRDEAGGASWPLADPTRTLAQLRESAEAQRDKRCRREKLAQEAARRKRLGTISANPDKALASIERLVKERSVASYEQAARELVDLGEALGPDQGPVRARAVAEKLRRENPRLKHLAAALKRQGLLD